MIRCRHRRGRSWCSLPPLGLVCLAALACAPAAPEPVATGRIARALTDAVVIGKQEEPAVVAVLIGDGASLQLCTGSLVGRRTVLTAAHCIKPGAPYRVFVAGDEHAGAAVRRHPKYDDNDVFHNHDLGLVTLETPSAVEPVALGLSVAPTKGMPLTLVGFGATSSEASPTGELRRAHNVVDAVEPLSFTVTGTGGGKGNVCHSDSGGPSLTTLPGGQRVQLGVASTGTTPCGLLSRYIRLDTYAGWLIDEIGDDLTRADLEAPRVKILAPEQGVVTSGGTVRVSLTFTDDVGVVGLELRLDGQPLGDVPEVGPELALPRVMELSLDPGHHELAARVTDAAGNQGTDSVRFRVAAEPQGDPPAVADAGVVSAGDEAGPLSGTDEEPTASGCAVTGAGSGSDVPATTLLLSLVLLVGTLRSGARRRCLGVRQSSFLAYPAGHVTSKRYTFLSFCRSACADFRRHRPAELPVEGSGRQGRPLENSYLRPSPRTDLSASRLQYHPARPEDGLAGAGRNKGLDAWDPPACGSDRCLANNAAT